MNELRFERPDGIELVARTRPGEGTPLVLVHGALADADAWQQVVDAIELPNPVVVVNRRGRAPSGPFGDGYSLRTEIDDLHHVLDSLGEPAVLFGHSYGGLIAQEAATERGDVRALVLYEPVVRPFGPESMAPMREAVRRGDLDAALEIVNVDIARVPAAEVAELRASELWAVLRPLAAAAAEELAVINDHEPGFERYAALDVATTLILGDRNDGVPPYGTVFDSVAAAMPRAKVVRLVDQGHLAHVEGPEALAAEISTAVP
ncbi:alpha/beta fold hydrolase [Saccharopolyspora sp. CA-218241]|uniref:alpha/beta fold hydrolase n=1 Tax=Saccharopolyspora sp. CA-218241 TaxID=3240027 RepID=UPI003D9604C8